MARPDKQLELWKADDTCFVVVLYEDTGARELAIQICDVLAQQFIGDLDFEFSWFRFDYLAELRVGKEAAENAAKADLIIVALNQSDAIPLDVKLWFEFWVSKRTAEDGALAVVRAASASDRPEDLDDSYLRSAAKRARLDYLPLFGSGSSTWMVDRLRDDGFLPGTFELHDPPGRQFHSSGWGINE